MYKYFIFLVPVLRRVLHTNKFTSAGGLLALLAVLLLKLHDIDNETFKFMIGGAIGLIGLASKDGVRGDATVAREDVPSLPPLPPTGAAVVLLLFSLGLFSACSGFLSRQAPSVAQDAVSKSLLASQLSQNFGNVSVDQTPVLAVAVSKSVVAAPDSIDLPPAQAHVQEAPYLVAPPAYLSKRERRQFIRAQRQNLRAAGRSAKVKLRKGAAYNAAPDGTAVAAKHLDAPAGFGANASATDNRKLGQHANGGAAQGRDVAASGATTPEKPPALLRWLKTAWSAVLTCWPVLLGLVVFAGLAWLRLSPFGRSVRAAAAFVRFNRSKPSAPTA